MRLHYPLSFLRLLLIGFALVALPPALALLGAFFSLDELGQRSAAAITRATQITRDSRAYGEHITALERLARQQIVLKDAAGLDAYEKRRAGFLALSQRLAPHAALLAIDADLASTREEEEAIWRQLRRGDFSPAAEQQVLRGFGLMSERAARIVSQADASIEKDIAELNANAAITRQGLLNQLWALLPVGILLIVSMLLLIRRPVRQLEAGIRGLGEGRFEATIEVDGPRDFVVLGQRLEWLRQRLRELDAQKTRLLHHVSHELKTPLTALQEGTALLSDQVTGPLNADQSEVVRILRSNCQRLRQLIENLLDYSSIRFQPSTLNRQRLDLAELIDQVLEDQKLTLAARGLGVVRQLDAQEVFADREKLRIALDNLLSNAIKYAPEGSPLTVRSRLDPSRPAARIAIEVLDEGAGIPADIAPQMFEPFVQGPAPLGSPVKGSGLGLAIVREYIGAHGGDVALLPNQPRGTCARIRLPASPMP